MSQTSYNMIPAYARRGVLADNRTFKHIRGRILCGTGKAGQGVFRVPAFGTSTVAVGNPGEVYQNPVPASPAAVAAILATGGASSGSIQVISGAALNGTTGTSEMNPARKLTLVLSNHANWSATTAVVRYYNHENLLVSENLAIPSGGNATVTTTGSARTVVDLTIPAQGGTSGTFTVGVAVLDSSVTLSDFDGFLIYRPTVISASTVAATAAEYADKSVVDVLQKGAVWVEYEGTAPSAGADVYVRVGTGSGGSALGVVRIDADSGSAIQITGAKFARVSGALAVVELF